MPNTHLPYSKKNIYGNFEVISPDGHLMFRCNYKKAKWYLDRNLAIPIDNIRIKLNFEPNGLGNHNKKYGLNRIKNICVVCGTKNKLTRHHVVPRCYRKFLPLDIKSHNFHDVLPMCIYHHEIYERIANEYKIELSKKYNAPINGEVIDNRDIIKIKRNIIVLTKENIPKKRQIFIKNEIKKSMGWQRITKKRIYDLINYPIKVYDRTHGEIVISKVEDIPEFVRSWRKHFIENNNCQFLPQDWSIDNDI